MPSRIIREGINSSDRVNALSTGAELFYRRLLNVVDDYGRYFGSVATLRTACWPTCPDKFTETQVTKMLSECLAGDKPLLSRYKSGSGTYICVSEFKQQIRSKSKFPEPPKCEADAQQLLSNCETNVHASRISYSEGVVDIGNLLSKSPPNGSRLTIETLPDEWAEFAKSECGWTRAQSEQIFASFRDYWSALAGAKARKTDWLATWRNWCRRQHSSPTNGAPRSFDSNGTESLWPRGPDEDPDIIDMDEKGRPIRRSK